MADDGIYRKTDKGRTEMATRANKLGLRERTLLIMVDDKTTRSGLLSRSAHPGTADILDALLAKGFIELILGAGSVTADAAPLKSSPPTAAGNAEPTPDFTEGQPRAPLSAEVKTAFQRIMAKYVGPMAEILCMEYFAQTSDPLEIARALAREIPNAERAAQFRAEIARLLDIDMS